MKLWVDAVQPAPNDQEFAWMRSVDMAMFALTLNERKGCPYEGIDLGHVGGGFGAENGKIFLEWLESTRRNYPVQIHAKDPFEKEILNGIVRKNGWDKLETFTVGIAVEGRAYVDVRACSPVEAETKANVDLCDADFGELEDIDWKRVHVEDEQGNYYYDEDLVRDFAGDEQEYAVKFAVDGRAYVRVQASDTVSAVKKACQEVCDLDFGELEDIEWNAVNVTDARGRLYDSERDLFGPTQGVIDDLIANAEAQKKENICGEKQISQNLGRE